MKRLFFIKSLVGTILSTSVIASVAPPIVIRGNRPKILQIGEFRNGGELHQMFGGGGILKVNLGEDKVLSVLDWKVSFEGEKDVCCIVQSSSTMVGIFATIGNDEKIISLFGGYTPEEIDTLANKGGILV